MLYCQSVLIRLPSAKAYANFIFINFSSMKLFMLIAAFCTGTIGAALFPPGSGNNNRIETDRHSATARCTGSNPCTACSNCSACKWCTTGGTCGVCSSKKTTPRSYKTPASSSGQCRATTKKRTRCSRSARSGGYCWQHGG